MSVGVVVIGRNEGERLVACLASLRGADHVVYVDSGSIDHSVANAEAAGATVVALDMSRPFTAARARNAGVARLPRGCDLVQVVDGDCTLAPGWLAAGAAAMAAEPGLGAVAGQLRERHPEASVYNWLCSVEWAMTPGLKDVFAGVVMLRRAAFEAAGRYRDGLIAGEEPELALRVLDAGWTIRALATPMAEHDAAITRFGQWWRRSTRDGHAYAGLATAGPRAARFRRRLYGFLFWGAAVPVAAALLLVLSTVLRSPWPAALAGAVLLLPLAQFARLWLKGLGARPATEAAMLAGFTMLAKPAQALGAWRWWRDRRAGRVTPIVEYKR